MVVTLIVITIRPNQKKGTCGNVRIIRELPLCGVACVIGQIHATEVDRLRAWIVDFNPILKRTRFIGIFNRCIVIGHDLVDKEVTGEHLTGFQ
ncbi:hypothetical protein CA13_01220 [Planctomycetes bacterium CA13]|uniref:Uncharacterized protein n=1 Tax=Novipirellula herctigrandis TaxID=2527986 RepID=A0A5C5YUS5_9BACT|nr:hypothetical protein CA13_01220 [Planctomycetes bacterium CA13]